METGHIRYDSIGRSETQWLPHLAQKTQEVAFNL